MSPRKASILAYCRVLGWLIAGMILVTATVEIDAQLQLQRARGDVQKREFLRKVRACVHDVHRPQSWDACEMIVQAQE